MNYKNMEKELIDFFNKYPDTINIDCIEDTVHDILLIIKDCAEECDPKCYECFDEIYCERRVKEDLIKK